MSDVHQRLRSARAEAARLRSWTSRIAADVATTEMESAALFEELAKTVPDRAEQLRRQAAAARSFADAERITAREGGSPSGDPA